MNKCVVTGGAGFIGSALVRALLRDGVPRVTVIDNLLTGREQNLSDVWPNVEMHSADVRHYDEIAPIIGGADVVFHLAAIPSVPRSINEPLLSHQVNVDGTFEVLRASVEGGVGRLVYAGSSSAYGDTDVLPKVETMLPNPKSPYAAQKLLGEYYASVFAACYNIETVSLRFFNVYGPRQDPSSPYSGVLSLFMKSLIERSSPTIYGDGEQSRDFTYVDDVAALCIKAAHAPGVSGKTYNAGNGNRYTLNYTWGLLQKIAGISLPANYDSPRPGDIRDSQADTTRAQAELDHLPKFSFEEGLRLTLEWYRSQGTNNSIP
jgi:UDP-glucose 4-epimerase